MSKWPKQLPVLTEEQKNIKNDFMKYWHEVLPKKYGIIEGFNHGYSIKYAKSGGRVLEIGSGLGEHIKYENLDNTEYTALELHKEMSNIIKKRFTNVNVVIGDCQERLPFDDNYFDRVLAIHVLEHLPKLPDTIKEIHRVLKPDGEFCVVIPCEGGFAYSLARKISAQSIFEKRYKISYDWCIKSEHLNIPNEIIQELGSYFNMEHRSFFPFKIPFIFCNLVIGMILKPKK